MVIRSLGIAVMSGVLCACTLACAHSPVAPTPVADPRYDGAFYRLFVLNDGSSRVWRPANARIRIEAGAPEADLQVAEAAARELLDAFGHSPMVSRVDASAGVVVRWAPGTTGPGGACGEVNALNRQNVTLYPDSPGCRCAEGKLSATVVKHEVGHALGFYHTNDPSDVMSPVWTIATCDKAPSERERFHARLAEAKPVGDNSW